MTRHILKIAHPILALFFLLVGNNACKDTNNSLVPYVEVNMNINPANYIELNIPGGVAYFKNEG
ncbi:MAG TPA: hypothetical protein PKO30_16015, partial [Prolixibacteraceae bacterium]|nr:hypothetical protein [Prolixibacteraceae bacterium]